MISNGFMQHLIPIAVTGLVHKSNSPFYKRNCFRYGFSAEIVLKPVSSKLFCLKEESTNAESGEENFVLVKNLSDMGVNVKIIRK